MTKCSLCPEEAIFLRPYSGERHCTKCYQRMLEKQVQSTISHYRILRPDDKVALALSGGKDSVSLLHIMKILEKRFPLSQMIAITIDEGIAGYRDEAIQIAKENCKQLDVEHYVYSFQKIYGHDLDSIAQAAKKKGKPFICSYCGILRRKALNMVARELGATKLATAHNLDDETQSMMMNVLRGDLIHMSMNGSNGEENEDLIPRIKPLSEIPEREVALYAFLKNITLQSFPCTYLETSLRSDVRKFLNIQEEKHPGMKFNIYRSFEKIKPHLTFPEKRNLNHCTACGELTTREICMSCQTLKDLELS